MVGFRRAVVHFSEHVMNKACLYKKPVSKSNLTLARIFYRCPEHGSCHRISRRMQAF